MEIKYQNIVLRDMRESDIDDEIRWNTVETQWALWDAPWEMEEELRNFDPEKHREKELKWIGVPKPDHRLSLEIDTADGVHIGSVSAYCIDDNFDWYKLNTEDDRRKANWAVGIEINESAYWSNGWGTQALTAFVKYHLEDGYTNLYTQTWSGNIRMIGLAQKLGFTECCRKDKIRLVRGAEYDGLTFRLNAEAFERYWERVSYAPVIPGAASMIAQKFGDYVTRFGCLHFGEGCCTLAAWIGPEPVGFISLLPERLIPPLHGRCDAFIDAIEVDASCRRQGIAGELVRRAELWAGQHGYFQIRAWSSDDKEEAIPMWLGLGYAVCPAYMAGNDLCPDGSGHPPLGYYAAKRLDRGE